MKRFFLVSAFNLIVFLSFAQEAFLQFHIGKANYQGDLQSQVFTLNQSSTYLSIQVNYGMGNNIGIRGGLSIGKIKAADVSSSKASANLRNLNFENNLFELHTALEYHFFDIESKRSSPYIFAGIAYFSHNPYTYAVSGSKVFLKPLSTEGQGLLAYPDRKPYKLSGISLPFGGGIKVNVSDVLRLGFEVGFRKTFTDYLDDVSDKYPDGIKLLSERGQQSVDLSYRGDELPSGIATFPSELTQRGNPSTKDIYYFTGITIGIRLLGSGESYSNNGNKKYIMGCPRNVY
jgi:hypothetical protein